MGKQLRNNAACSGSSAPGSRRLEDTARLHGSTPRHYAYLKISEGCDRLCTFCAIPKMRGKHITKPIEEVLREAQELAADGVRELLIVAQDSTYYGMDLYGKVRFAELLRELEKVEGIEWIRILYAYPEHISDELLQTLADSRKIVPYIDMPLQHINDRVLKRMQRRVNRRSTEDLIRQTAPASEAKPGVSDDVHRGLPRAKTTPSSAETLRFRQGECIRTGRRLHLFLGTRHARRQAGRPHGRRSETRSPQSLDGDSAAESLVQIGARAIGH